MLHEKMFLIKVVFYLHILSVLCFAFASNSVDSSSSNFSELVGFDLNNESTTNHDPCLSERTLPDLQVDLDNSSLSSHAACDDSVEEFDYSRFSEHFLNCVDHHGEVKPELYIKLENGSVLVPLYGKLFNETDYIISETGWLVICTKFYDEHPGEHKFSNTLDIFSVVGIAISSFCIVLHILMFLWLKKLRNLPGYCLFSLCVALLIAYTCMFIVLGLEEESDCFFVGLTLLYSFLASFFWMNVMSFDVWRSLRMATAKLRLTSDRPMFMRFALYSAYSWGIPLLIVSISLIVNYASKASGNHIDPRYTLVFSNRTCWLQDKRALLLYFGGPVFSLISINALLFISSFIMISAASMNTVENRGALWSRFMVCLRIAVVMGLSWVSGIIAAVAQKTALWYIFTILNTLQGFFIFFSFSFTKKTIRERKRVITLKKSSLFSTQVSSSRGRSSSTQQESAL